MPDLLYDHATLPLTNFLEHIEPAITSLSTTKLQPRFQPQDWETAAQHLLPIQHHLYPEQRTTAAGTAYALKHDGWANLVGEMATGKTRMGAAITYLLKASRTLIMCPPHLTKKWQREAAHIIPNSRVVLLKHLRHLDQYFTQDASPKQPLVGIISRERAKLSYRRTSALVPQRVSLADPTLLHYRCPDCGHRPFDPVADLPFTPDTLKAHSTCNHCQTPLMTVDRQGPRRFALVDYLAKHYPHRLDLVIFDEAHELSAKGSAQSRSAHLLINHSKAALNLTGTLTNGKSTSIFWMLFRNHPAIRHTFKFHEEHKWVSRFGVWETQTITQEDSTTIQESGNQSKRRVYQKVTERPGLSPGILPYLLSNTTFLQLADLGQNLPPYQEHLHAFTLPEPLQGHYRTVEHRLKTIIRQARKNQDGHLASSATHAILRYPDHAWREEVLINKWEKPVETLPVLPQDFITPKEQALMDLCGEKQRIGEKVLVYAYYTRTKSIFPHLIDRLNHVGLRTALIPSTVTAENREAWIATHEHEWDVLLTNPRQVNTGLDLLSYPTICFYDPEYHITVFRQAARRSYRPGQTKPVNVHIFYYEETAQAIAWTLIGSGIKQSLRLEGILPTEGLGADDDHDTDILQAIMATLLRQEGHRPTSPRELFRDIARLEHQEQDRPLISEEPHPPRNPQPAPPSPAQTGEQLTLFAA